LAGFSFDDFFKAKVGAPIVQLHIDYFRPLFLDEEFFVEASLIWHEGARINIEYRLIKTDGSLAASGYTVQMFVAEDGSPFMVTPGFIEASRKRWKNGEIL
jgi:acyl-CoA thioester hydrolase